MSGNIRKQEFTTMSILSAQANKMRWTDTMVGFSLGDSHSELTLRGEDVLKIRTALHHIKDHMDKYAHEDDRIRINISLEYDPKLTETAQRDYDRDMAMLKQQALADYLGRPPHIQPIVPEPSTDERTDAEKWMDADADVLRDYDAKFFRAELPPRLMNPVRGLQSDQRMELWKQELRNNGYRFFGEQQDENKI